MRKILILLLVFFTIATNAQKKQGQALIDSLVAELPKMKEDSLKVMAFSDISYEFRNIDPEKGLVYSKKGLALSKIILWQDGVAYSYFVMGLNYTSLDDFENALKYSNKALSLTKNKKILSKIYRNIGLIYTYQNDYPKGLKYDNISLKIFEEINDLKGQAAVLSNIGIIYFDLKNYSKAIEHYNKARIINEKMQNLEYLTNNLGNLGNCYKQIKDYNKAIVFYDKAIEMASKQNNKSSKAIFLSTKGLLFYELKQYDKAIEISNQSLKINQEIGNKSNIANNIGCIGDSYLAKALIEKNQNLKKLYLKKAFESLNQTLIIEKKLGITKEVAVDYSQIAKIQEFMGDYKSALNSERLSKIYNDSIYNSTNKETIKNLEDKRTIDLKEKEIQINKLSLKAKEQQKWYYISGLGFLAILGGLFFYQSKNRKKINQKLQVLNANLDVKNHELDVANKTKTRFFSILNHDLRGPVSNLIDFLHIQKNAPDLLDEVSKKRIETSTIKGAENLLSSMEDILLWSKGQMENFKPQPKNIAVNQLFEDTQKVFSGYVKIKFDYQNPQNIEVITDENYLKTIVRNLTSNAINVFSTTQNPSIIWKAWQENDNSYLSITDNGPGATQDQFKALYDEKEVVGIKSGLGLHLIRDLAKAINCEITVDSKIGFGTTFTLKIK